MSAAVAIARGRAILARALRLAASLGLAGCAGFGTPAPSEAPPVTIVQEAERRIAAAAERAEAALSRLARQQGAGAAPPADEIAGAAVPPELLAEVELDWTGPLPGYGFREAGARPHRAPIVTLPVNRHAKLTHFGGL